MLIPKATPVPVMASRLKNKAAVLFAVEPAVPFASPVPLPTIIEVPRRLARMEPQLAALDRDGNGTMVPGITGVEPDEEDRPATQKELF